jgi:raffinose/stachyose/melibiose transport system permease protein
MGNMSALPIRRRSPRREPSTASYYIVLSALALFAIGPLAVLVFNSLKSPAEAGRNPIGIPTEPVISNFPRAWRLGEFSTTTFNSTFLTVSSVLGVCFIAGLAAYALARLNPPGGSVVLMYLIAGTAIPVQLFLVPLFFLWTNIGLMDTLPGLVIIYLAIFSPFATLLLRSYLVALPREFEEAARVDGANEIQVLTRVVLPLAWPGFLTIALVTGLAVWNEFFFAITFIQDSDLYPIATSFLAFQRAFTRDWGLTSAAGLIMIVPVMTLFLLLQRQFIAGLTSAGIKG